MSFIIAIIIGAIAGWLAGTIVRGRGFGVLGNILLGVVGGLIGNFAAGFIGIEDTNWIGRIIISTIGAAIILLILNALGVQGGDQSRSINRDR